MYNPRSKIYTVCLNEDKTYELKFGDGITGRRLNKGDRIYVFYLESDGEDGEMDLVEIDFSSVKLKHDWIEMESVIPAGLCEKMFGSTDPGDDKFGVARFIGYASDGKIKVSTT